MEDGVVIMLAMSSVNRKFTTGLWSKTRFRYAVLIMSP